jgi:hypothetical protein
MHHALLAVGCGQLLLVVASLWLPRVLGWRRQLAALEPLTRRVFWVYAGYVVGTNVCLGGLSVLAPELLLDRSPLARAVAGYAAAWWGMRLLIQFVWFRGKAPRGLGYALADIAVTLGFAACTLVYGAIVCDLW